ncbi:ferritin-like domain-containing protein [Flavobacterium sp.]|uniref:YciE/YciF ferroxidase family protein n=1 Tax=Flavobacterium sp. TaxID=239 RepID=UPI002B4ACD2B|nr:ferritin-like domain-containing protein [Flavobacterium sp.]HLF53458.1 ferritin-like domain-containing protein [Flavobacterium sp.]
MEPSMKKQENAKGVVKATASAAKGLRELFEVGLNDIYYAEKVMTKSLPKMVENASSPELVTALKNHLAETEEHVSRLEKIFKSTGIKTVAKKSNAMEGLIKESEVTMKETELGNVRDAGIIAAGQKVEHYEIATYGTLHAFAKTLGEDKAAQLLAMNLDEKKKTDAALTGIAMASINAQAAAPNPKW